MSLLFFRYFLRTLNVFCPSFGGFEFLASTLLFSIFFSFFNFLYLSVVVRVKSVCVEKSLLSVTFYPLRQPGSGTGTEGIEILPGILFERYPRMLVTTFWGDPAAAPKSDPPNFVNNVDEDDSPVLAELSS